MHAKVTPAQHILMISHIILILVYIMDKRETYSSTSQSTKSEVFYVIKLAVEIHPVERAFCNRSCCSNEGPPIVIHCDNLAILQIWQAKNPPNQALARLCRTLIFLAARNSFIISQILITKLLMLYPTSRYTNRDKNQCKVKVCQQMLYQQ